IPLDPAEGVIDPIAHWVPVLVDGGAAIEETGVTLVNGGPTGPRILGHEHSTLLIDRGCHSCIHLRHRRNPQWRVSSSTISVPLTKYGRRTRRRSSWSTWPAARSGATRSSPAGAGPSASSRWSAPTAARSSTSATASRDRST